MVTKFVVAARGSWYDRTHGSRGCGCTVRRATALTPEIRCVKHVREFIWDEGPGLIHIGFVPPEMTLDEFERLFEEALEEEYWRSMPA